MIKKTRFGKDCSYQTAQLDENGDITLVYCNHVDNKNDYEGNCNENNCPFNKKEKIDVLKYEYVYFKKTGISKVKHTDIYTCYTNSDNTILAHVKWNAAWRQYCFYIYMETVYSAGCLEDILDFIGRVNKEHRGNIKE